MGSRVRDHSSCDAYLFKAVPFGMRWSKEKEKHTHTQIIEGLNFKCLYTLNVFMQLVQT